MTMPREPEQEQEPDIIEQQEEPEPPESDTHELNMIWFVTRPRRLDEYSDEELEKLDDEYVYD
jgi:hypothetical protein